MHKTNLYFLIDVAASAAAYAIGPFSRMNKLDSREYNFDGGVIHNERTKDALSAFETYNGSRRRIDESSKERIMAGKITEAARETMMKTGDSVKTTKLIRSQKTGVLLPRQGTFVRDIENLGRKLILVDFGPAGEEHLFPDELLAET